MDGDGYRGKDTRPHTLVCFLKKPIDVSHKLLVFVLQSKLCNTLDFKSCLNKEILASKFLLLIFLFYTIYSKKDLWFVVIYLIRLNNQL